MMTLCGSYSAKASPLELLRCVQELKAIRSEDRTAVEFQNGVAMGAMAQTTAQKILLIANERGVFAFKLKSGLNYLQIEIPNPDPRRLAKSLFLVYFQSEIYGSKLMIADWDLPSDGQAPSKFLRLSPLPLHSAQAEQYFQNLIAQDLRRLSELYRQNLITRADLMAGNLSLCRTSRSTDPKLTQWIHRQINELEFVSVESRMPKRVPASTFSGK